VAQNSLAPSAFDSLAKRRLETFEDRFGKAHLHLAYHAALPLALTPDLMYRLWANFQQDVHGELLNVPWVVVADLLLSSLCEEVGHELYEMNRDVRAALLDQLKHDVRFGQLRIWELSEFLLTYVQQQLGSPDADIRDRAKAQRWAAISYIQPHKAAKELSDALVTTYQHDKIDCLRIAAIVETLADPLAEFEPLLADARAKAAAVRAGGKSSNLTSLKLGKMFYWAITIMTVAIFAGSVRYISSTSKPDATPSPSLAPSPSPERSPVTSPPSSSAPRPTVTTPAAVALPMPSASSTPVPSTATQPSNSSSSQSSQTDIPATPRTDTSIQPPSSSVTTPVPAPTVDAPAPSTPVPAPTVNAPEPVPTVSSSPCVTFKCP